MNQRGAESGDETNLNAETMFQSLISRARMGEVDAVGALIERYRNYLLLIANENVQADLRAKVGASDVVQESIMQAQLKFKQFDGDSENELKAWLRAILANDIRQSRRKFSTRKRNANLEVNVQEQSAVGRVLLDQQLTPSSQAVQEEKAQALSAAMSQLSRDQQQVVQFRNFESLGFDEIGKRMDRSADAARKLWVRAIESLEGQLRQLAPEMLTGQQLAGEGDE